ncbi:calcium homeostasis modulator protein 6 [Echeneis naucrates]|uniref:Calcium homeostasis modulator family member 6 n=1 Tax=Echeneis naucrates TaxID=173247 RepID=A0A665T0S9_ECHNA|nr:calcium homeostasis modulator protein 6 [Echeneis naucrates]
MEKFKTILNIAHKQTNLGCGLVALLTAGGEQIFSTVVFRCPCSELSFLYGLVSMLVPALALLLLGYILNKRTWKLLTGVCHREAKLSCWKMLATTWVIFFQISTMALVAPSSWIAVALLNGNYFECMMTGINASAIKEHLCEKVTSPAKCTDHLHGLPCATDIIPTADRDEVLLSLRAMSQIAGWLLIASIMLCNLMLTCLGRCMSPISYLQLKFWKVYAQEENNLIDSYTSKHAKELAERNLKSFFDRKFPEPIHIPSNRDWENISSLYKFSPKKQFYSTLHQYVENCQTTDSGVIRMASVQSQEDTDIPPVLAFVDGASSTM